MSFTSLVLEEKDKSKIQSYSKKLKIKEFFYSKKIKNEYLSVFYLVNIQFWKSKTFPFFAFIFPIFFIGILGQMLGYENMFSNVLSISSTSIGLIALPTSILEFKNSILLKRIGVTKVSPSHFIMIMFIFYFLIMLLGTLFTIVLSIILFHDNWHGAQFKSIILGREKQVFNVTIPYIFKNGITIRNKIYAPPFKEYFKNANWAGVVYGYLLNSILSLMMGVVITSFAKSLMALQALAVPIMVISNFLSGQVLPLNLIISNPTLWNISYFTPFKFTNNIIIESFNGNPSDDSLSTVHLDLSDFATKLSSTELSKLFKKSGNGDSNISTIINHLKNGTYNGSNGNGVKYEWLKNGESGVSVNGLVTIQEPVDQYMMKFFTALISASNKASNTLTLQNIVGKIFSVFETILGKSRSPFDNLFEIEGNAFIDSYKVPNIKPSNPFDIFSPHKSLNLTNDRIITIITSLEKVLSHTGIYLWILGLMGVGMHRFKWSTR